MAHGPAWEQSPVCWAAEPLPMGYCACIERVRSQGEKMMHNHPDVTDLGLPHIEALGRDLLETTLSQRWMALARPFMGIMAYALAAELGWWFLTPFIVFLI